jgi:phosphoglycolate phosphatase-like HAD superfamily hydrolase
MATSSLESFQVQHDCFIGIDSDGCAFDSMELKQKECFAPNVINYWHLQRVSKLARETWEFVNLYSKWRGINRFIALVKALELLAERPEAQRRGYSMPEIATLREWMDTASALGNPALQKRLEENSDPVLEQTMAWSNAVNDTVREVVHDLPPFPNVPACLEKMVPVADVMVVSATPIEALMNEWKEHDIDQYPQVIAGQEQGNKKEHLQIVTAGKYDADRVLMIGDAPGDMKAAKANNALFFPINPGAEEDSWQFLLEEGLDAFVAGKYAGELEAKLIADFERRLPEQPPWKTA